MTEAKVSFSITILLKRVLIALINLLSRTCIDFIIMFYLTHEASYPLIPDNMQMDINAYCRG